MVPIRTAPGLSFICIIPKSAALGTTPLLTAHWDVVPTKFGVKVPRGAAPFLKAGTNTKFL